MITFNECRIDKEGKTLIINASVSDLPYYENIYIESITIDTDKTFIENGPSSEPIFTQSFSAKDEGTEGEETAYHGVVSRSGVFTIDATTIDGLKNINLEISAKELGLETLSDNIFFIYLAASGVPDPSTPCGMDNKYTVGVAINMRPIYDMSMMYINELSSTCNIPKGFIDSILKLKALDLSLKTGNYLTAIKWWDKLFKNKEVIVSTRKCNCNGIYP